ncbi:hypothetical protein BKA64DRAFT_710657 [Cadophora sp. MPI-SDFR-AT-0126]|nr:hypothetical protein BKA64DRAFT_710657 [Leotiomycetes sp. MPI-SDFR-AT-0126]
MDLAIAQVSFPVLKICLGTKQRSMDMRKSALGVTTVPEGTTGFGITCTRSMKLGSTLLANRTLAKGVSTQQPLPRVVKSPGLDNRAVVMNQDGSNLVCLPVTTEDNGHIAENDFQNMAPQDIVHFEEQLTRPQQVQLTTPSFSQPFAQPVSMAERLQQAQTSASLANIPHGLPESQHTFGYIPTSGVSNGMGVNNYPQRPPPVSNQLSISQVDFPLISDPHLISDPQSESFPAPLRSQQQHFEQPAWDSSVYPQAGYTHHEVGYQTLIDISLPFNQVAPVTPADMHNTSPRPMPAAVESAADTSEPQKSSSPTSDHFENSITDYFSGYSGNSQELAYLNDFED